MGDLSWGRPGSSKVLSLLSAELLLWAPALQGSFSSLLSLPCTLLIPIIQLLHAKGMVDSGTKAVWEQGACAAPRLASVEQEWQEVEKLKSQMCACFWMLALISHWRERSCLFSCHPRGLTRTASRTPALVASSVPGALRRLLVCTWTAYSLGCKLISSSQRSVLSYEESFCRFFGISLIATVMLLPVPYSCQVSFDHEHTVVSFTTSYVHFYC